MKNYELKIVQDEDPINPRTWDNLGIIAYKSKYIIGEEEIDDPVNWLCEKIGADPFEYAEKYGMYPYTDEFKEIVENEFLKKYYAIPLSLYDHSGIVLKCGIYHGWDVGQVGYIYTTEERRKEFGTPKERVLGVLRGEVETMNKYLTGDVWGYEVLCDGDVLDSCWGYYSEEVARKDGEDMLAYYKEKDRKDRHAKLKVYIKNRVPLEKRILS